MIDEATVAFLRYHAVEEIEHKGVAFDCYTSIYQASPMATTAAQQQWQSFMFHMRTDIVRSVKYCLMVDRLKGKRDGLSATAIESTLAAHFSLFASEGTVYRLAEPGFHPWDIDDHALLACWDPQVVS